MFNELVTESYLALFLSLVSLLLAIRKINVLTVIPVIERIQTPIQVSVAVLVTKLKRKRKKINKKKEKN